MTLSDEAVGVLVNRSKQAVYCKRWSMKLYGKRARGRKALAKSAELAESYTVSGDVVGTTVSKAVANSVERIVLGNVTIDLVSKTLTVHF